MSTTDERPLSRRALVAGTLGALGGALASALVRPLPVEATHQVVAYLNDENASPVLTAQSVTKSGFVNSGKGFGVQGFSTKATGVYGKSTSGRGVYGSSTSGVGAQGLSTSSYGVSGSSTSSTGVFGYSSTGNGVVGSSGARGGVFSGTKAQVKLVPAAGSHPAAGERGDLFVDNLGNLWYCKTTSTTAATWVNLTP